MMNPSSRLPRWLPAASVALVALWGLAAARPARADIIQTPVAGYYDMLSAPELKLTPISLTTAGTLVITLTDLKFTTTFQTLSFALLDSHGVLHQETLGTSTSASFSFNVTAPMKLYIAVFADPRDGSGGFYKLDCHENHVAPVPLPASVWLLGSACLGLARFRRRHALSLAATTP